MSQILTNIDLDLVVQAKHFEERELFEDAAEKYTQIIEAHKSMNPVYKYKRAKCYYNMGKDYVNQARSDLWEASSYLVGKPK